MTKQHMHVRNTYGQKCRHVRKHMIRNACLLWKSEQQTMFITNNMIRNTCLLLKSDSEMHAHNTTYDQTSKHIINIWSKTHASCEDACTSNCMHIISHRKTKPGT